MSNQRCWIGRATEGDDYCAAAVYATSVAEARRLLWTDDCLAAECDGNFFNLRARRAPELDALRDPGITGPHLVSGDAYLRSLGFAQEGDRTCASCGLAEMAGKFPVCPECGQCTECVCDCEPGSDGAYE